MYRLHSDMWILYSYHHRADKKGALEMEKCVKPAAFYLVESKEKKQGQRLPLESRQYTKTEQGPGRILPKSC